VAKRDANWWELFNDPMLSAIVDATLKNNLSLESANANVRAAFALYSGVQTNDNLVGGFDATYNDGERLISGVIDEQTRITFINTGANLNINLDVFGKLKRAQHAAKADALAAQFAMLDLRVSLAAQAALRYSDYLNALMRINVAERSIASLERTRAFVATRTEEGLSSQFDLSRVDSDLYGLRALVPEQRATAERARQALLVLTGRSIEIAISPDRDLNASFPSLEQPVAIGDPQNLLRQRPDVHEAEQELIASTERTGVAVGNLYPDVSISGFRGFITNDSLDFNRNTQAWSVAPSLSWNIFDFQPARTGIKIATARQEASLANFKERVLIALSEAEVALSDYKASQSQRALLEQQFAASNQALGIAREQFNEGAVDLLSLLDIRRTQLTAEDSLVQAKNNNFSALINIYLAFGGGVLDVQQKDQEASQGVGVLAH
jgi:multidrug efflux system outer membrane protein